MKRYLVVANQTLAGHELLTAIRELATAEPAHFHILVPNTPAKDQADAWIEDSGTRAGGQEAGGGAAETGEEVTRRARNRLEAMLQHVTELGAEGAGEIGEPDPLEAVRHVLHSEQFDEVLLSTLPAGLSRWLGMDLPSRVRRIFDGPVTVIEASGRSDRRG